MLINEVYQLVNFIADKNGRGYITPAQFNLLAKTCQLEFVSSRLGNIKQQDNFGVPQFGHRSTRRIDVDLRPFIYGPETISINPQGNFYYPYGFMWPDAWHKSDLSDITELQNDEYPSIKKNPVIEPTSDYPIIIFRNPYGFIDPYSIGSFQMTYVKYPSTPVWGYGIVNDEPVFDSNLSTDFILRDISMMDITALILEKVGLNLDKDQLLQYALAKQVQGT